MNNFEINQEGLDRLFAEVQVNAQAKMDPAVDAAVAEVRARYAGESVGEIYEQLVTALNDAGRATFGGGVQINEPVLRQFAETIVSQTKTD